MMMDSSCLSKVYLVGVSSLVYQLTFVIFLLGKLKSLSELVLIMHLIYILLL